MTSYDDIEAALDEHVTGGVLPESFRVTDDGTAGWALGKLHAAETERDRVKAVAAERRAAITEWETQTLKPIADRIGFFVSVLTDYRRQLHDADPKAPATYKLPEGDLKWSKGGTLSTVTTDPKAFAEFVEEYGATGLVEYVPKVKADDVKKSTEFARHHAPDGTIELVTPDGQIVPGIHFVEKQPSVTVITNRPVAFVTDPEPSEGDEA